MNTDTDNKEVKEPIHFSLKLPTLKELSLIRIARCLCNSKNVRPAIIQKIFKEQEKFEFSLLPLPSNLIKQLLPVVHHVVKELYYWLYPFEKGNYRFATEDTFEEWENGLRTENVEYLERIEMLHEEEFKEWPDRVFQDYIIHDKIIWSAYGIVDSAQMARLILRDETIPLVDRFVISCHLCLEDEVGRLWDEMTFKEFDKVEESCLVSYWVHRMLGEVYDHRSHKDFRYIHELKYIPDSAEEFFIEELRNSSAIDFQYPWFWSRLDDSQKARQLAIFKRKEIYRNDYVFFLLNQLVLDQQKEFLFSSVKNPEEYLRQFLQRPMQHLFFPTLKIMNDRKCLIRFAEDLSGYYLEECDDEMQERVMAELDERGVNPNSYMSECACVDPCQCYYWQNN